MSKWVSICMLEHEIQLEFKTWTNNFLVRVPSSNLVQVGVKCWKCLQKIFYHLDIDLESFNLTKKCFSFSCSLLSLFSTMLSRFLFLSWISINCRSLKFIGIEASTASRTRTEFGLYFLSSFTSGWSRFCYLERREKERIFKRSNFTVLK